MQVFVKISLAFKNDDLLGQILRSLKAVSLGLIIAMILTTLMIGGSKLIPGVDFIMSTLSALMHPLPGIAILPIFMIWFGLGEAAIIAVIVHSVIWPLYSNLTMGIKSIPDLYSQVSRGFGLKGIKACYHVTLPSVLPYLLSGLRTGWARAWRALISAEMIFGAIGGGGGLGWFIFKNRVFMDTAGMFAGLIVVICVGLIVERGVFDLIETKTLKKWGMMQ